MNLDISKAIQREPDPHRVQQLEIFIAAAMRRCDGEPTATFKNLIALADGDSELRDALADVVALAILRYVMATVARLQEADSAREVPSHGQRPID